MIERIWVHLFGETLAQQKRVAPDTVRVICFVHNDRHPSLDINLRKNVWLCRACGVGGGYLDLIVRAGEARDHSAAWRWCQDRNIA